MPRLTIVADITAKPESIAIVKAALEATADATRPEEGCVQDDMHQDNQKPEDFLFFEIWESRALWQRHMNAAHLQEFRAKTEGAIAEFRLYEMTQVA